MAKWNYTITSGTALREAINSEDTEQVVTCLVKCYKELLNQLSEQDRYWNLWDMDDTIEFLETSEDLDEDEINYCLEEFYNMCDDLRAFVAL